jgi:microcystin degradation protein MlrC
VLAAGLDRVAMAALCDPEAAEAMHAAGAGAAITIGLGGKAEMPSLGLKGQPLRLTGKVLKVTDGRWIVAGPMYTGINVDTGPTAVFETGGMKIVVTSRHHEPWDAGILTNNGIDPAVCSYILLKSRIHYRAGFQPIQPDLGAHFTLDGWGVTTSDNNILTYRNLRRPIYPLDPEDQIDFP